MLKMRCSSRARSIFLVLLLGLPHTVVALPEELIVSSLGERYRRAEMVAVVNIRFIAELVNITLSQPGMMAIAGYRYTAELGQVWKAPYRFYPSGAIKFQIDLTHCLARLKQNQSYIFFGYRNEQGLWQSDDCDQLSSPGEWGAVLLILDKIAGLQMATTLKN